MIMESNIQRMIGSSAELAKTLDHASALASINRPVLILGERGTGKELIAERLHFLSPRWDQAFISLNCAAISEDLMESELFGHEPGAFTGANKIHQGRFERADGGSLFLDELGNMSLRLQEKLLRVIEYGEFERLGGHKTLKIDVRVIAATNADLKHMAKEGTFRADLLDRLAFDVITIPPLRQRRSDIPELAEYFAMRMSIELGWHDFVGFSQQALDELMTYSWPGNIRELKNVVERSLFRHGQQFSAGQFTENQLTKNKPAILNTIIIDPFPVTTSNDLYQSSEHNNNSSEHNQSDDTIEEDEENTLIPFKQALSNYEKQLLLKALKANHNHQKRTAKVLGLSYDQLRGLIKKHLK